MTTQQGVWSETSKLLVNFWGADLSGFAHRRSNGEIVTRHWTFSAELSKRTDIGSEVQEDVAEVLDSGFLAWRSISSSSEPLVVAFLPITQENQVTRVLLVGHSTSGLLPKDLLNAYLALAGLVGTTAERLASEVELRKHRQHLEELVGERTAELVVTNEQLRNEIHERKQVESDLQRSNAELQQFAYVASHDLQEPLRMIASYVQLIQRRYRDRIDEDADEFIAYAVDGAKRMQGLIHGLLQYSRVGTHGKPFETIDCEIILDKALANLQILLTESGAQVTHDPLPTLSADSMQLVQLFQNLIDNACKFRDDATPQIHVSARLETGQWLFSVSDNGIGIDPEYAERIFIIFQRLHGREAFPGTGLGLAICKKIVERHGGKIWVESGNRKGTTFCFTIPVRHTDV